MKKMIALVLCLVLALSTVGCGTKAAENGSTVDSGVDMSNNNEVVNTEKIDNTTDEDLSNDNKHEEPGTSEYVITIAKTKDEIENGIVLSEKETISACTAIATSESENGWVNDVSKCAVSCYIAVETTNEKICYNYCDYGILDDTKNVKSLELTDSSRNTLNNIFSKYIVLSDTIRKDNYFADDVTMSIVTGSYKDNKATFIIKNNSDEEYTYRPEYSLEEQVNGEWLEIVLDPPLSWNAIALTLEPQSDTEFEVDFLFGYGELKEGTYRLCKGICDKNGNRSLIYAEFTIPELCDGVPLAPEGFTKQ